MISAADRADFVVMGGNGVGGRECIERVVSRDPTGYKKIEL